MKKADAFDYIERSDNPKCRNSTLDYLSPMEFENELGLAQLGVQETASRPRYISRCRRCHLPTPR